MSRAWFTSRLKSARSVGNDVESSVTSAGWPGGASPGVNRYHTSAAARMVNSASKLNVRRRCFMARYGSQSASIPAITCGNRMTSSTIAAETQNTITDE